jgi:hypothetical protein
VATAGFGARMGCLLVALAEAFDATLLTMDERLARAHGPTCRIDVLGVAVIVVGSSPNPQRSATLPITRTPLLRARQCDLRHITRRLRNGYRSVAAGLGLGRCRL